MPILPALSAPNSGPPASTVKQRLVFVGIAGLTFLAALLALRGIGARAPQPTARPLQPSTPSSEPSAATPSAAFTREQRRTEFASALLDDAISALEQRLKGDAVGADFDALFELRAFGPKARPEAVTRVLELWNEAVSDQAKPSANAELPEIFSAAPLAALASALLDAGRTLDAQFARARLAPAIDTLGDSSALALHLEAQTLLALRQPEAADAGALGRYSALAQARLDRSLRSADALGWQDWQLACALMHAPPEVDPERRASARRLWARLQNSPLPSDAANQALRTEALASAIKAGVIVGNDSSQLLVSELEHLRYLVNSESDATTAAGLRARSAALRALRLGKSAL